MKIMGLVAARPNFIKMAPVFAALRTRPEVKALLVHTGQHFDRAMSEVFFDELGLPRPDINLGVGQLTAWMQTGRIIERLGDVIARERPDWVLVAGDVNSTIAGALAAVRCATRLAHLESGLRSFDRSMPEELNRIATDHLADLLFVTEPSGLENLKKEGIPESRIQYVGNTMIDTLLRSRELARGQPIFRELGLSAESPFILVTMHRPATVDRREGLEALLEVLAYACSKGTVVFPVHPRTRKNIAELGLEAAFQTLARLIITEPMSYLSFLALMDRAKVVMTDSGGIQEETTVLGTPCLTLRDTTERPVTCTLGTNRLVGTNPKAVRDALDAVWENPPHGSIPPGWDGMAAERVLDCLAAMAPDK